MSNRHGDKYELPHRVRAAGVDRRGGHLDPVFLFRRGVRSEVCRRKARNRRSCGLQGNAGVSRACRYGSDVGRPHHLILDELMWYVGHTGHIRPVDLTLALPARAREP